MKKHLFMIIMALAPLYLMAQAEGKSPSKGSDSLNCGVIEYGGQTTR